MGKTFSLRKKKLNFSRKEIRCKAHLSVTLRKKTSFPRKFHKKSKVSFKTPKFEKTFVPKKLVTKNEIFEEHQHFPNPISLARNLEKNPNLIDSE